MAVPPTIPTSFVPHTGPEARRPAGDFAGAFGFFAYFVFALAAFSAVAVFGYERFLAAKRVQTDEELQQAARALDPQTVSAIVRLRDRLLSAETLLNEHIVLSRFFAALETSLPTNVRFTKLRIVTEDDGRTVLSASGVAQTFNALAATSDAFAQDGRIKNAIFSGISVVEGKGIAFSLTAVLDPELVAFSVLAPAPENVSTEEGNITTP